MIAADDPRHGSPRGYRAGCHERCCLDAAALYQRRRSKLKAMGRGRRVDPTGTKRRIQALQALGWTQAHIASATGLCTAATVTKILRDSSAWVFPSTAARVSQAYDVLSMRPGPSQLTVKYAARRGWPPPLAWDDDTIDDPAAKPYRPTSRNPGRGRDLVDEVLVQRALSGQPVTGANPAERRLVIEGWRKSGRPLNELERIQGWATHRDLREAS